MVELVTLKLSTKTNGIIYEDISEEKALELIRCNIGIKGPKAPHKITIVWSDGPEMAEVKPSEVTGEPSVDKTDDVKTAPVIDKTPPETEDKISKVQPASTDDSKKTVLLSEIGRIDKYDFTTTKYISIESNLSYAETDDGRISIKYAGTKINTTWKKLVELEQSIGDPITRGVPLLEGKDEGNRRTAVTKFINKLRINGIKQGDGIKLFNQIFNDKPNSGTVESKDGDTDPDADFKSTGVGSSVYPPSSPAGQDFGKG